jgi:hypothetical protein
VRAAVWTTVALVLVVGVIAVTWVVLDRRVAAPATTSTTTVDTP